MIQSVKRIKYLLIFLVLAVFLSSCGNTSNQGTSPSNFLNEETSSSQSPNSQSSDEDGAGNQASNSQTTSSNTIDTTDSDTEDSTNNQAPDNKGARDNSIRVLVAKADGNLTKENSIAILDYSNSDSGYVCLKYTGTNSKVKLRIMGPDEVVYTYDVISDDYATFPLTGGNGIYTIAVYENIQGTEYSTAFFETIEVNIKDELSPYLYPNQYANFDESMDCIALSADIVYEANSDLEAVSLIYNYIIQNISYDYSMAESPPKGYISNPDSTLESKTGICLDYAVLMLAMLRSQGIPTRLEVGYAADAYHAWISVYLNEIGWVNGIIEFEADTWTLMDPTFGANSDESELKKFIGDGSNYILQKIY